MMEQNQRNVETDDWREALAAIIERENEAYRQDGKVEDLIAPLLMICERAHKAGWEHNGPRMLLYFLTCEDVRKPAESWIFIMAAEKAITEEDFDELFGPYFAGGDPADD